MKEENVLLTGFRLIAILELLYKKDASKKEIIEYCAKKHKIKNFSGETLKLDINTLIKAGFKIKRGTSKNNYRLHLEKDFALMKLTKDEFNMLNIIKNAGLEFLNYKDIIHLKSFYNRISSYIQDDVRANLCDFRFYNLVNDAILEELEKIIERKGACTIVYDSPLKGRVEAEIIPKKFITRNDKLYLDCINQKFKTRSTYRADNIKLIKRIFEKSDAEKEPALNPKTTYWITKDYYERSPLEKPESVLSISDNAVEIVNSEEDDFFVVQRLLTLGKNCSHIEDKAIKEKVINNLKETLELYK